MARRKLKMRQLGTLRLLAELFNRDLLTPPIMKIVTAELLNRSKTAGVYDSELIECVVQVRFFFLIFPVCCDTRTCTVSLLDIGGYYHLVCWESSVFERLRIVHQGYSSRAWHRGKKTGIPYHHYSFFQLDKDYGSGIFAGGPGTSRILVAVQSIVLLQ